MSPHDLASYAVWVSIGFFLLANSLYGLQVAAAYVQMRRDALRNKGETLWRVLGSAVAPRISIIAPSYNEEATIVESARSLLGLYYPDLEVIVVNDGSTDSTLGRLQEAFHLEPHHTVWEPTVPTERIKGMYRSRLYPHLIVVDKENGGKADALNAGLDLASGELVCAIDSDTLVEADALQRMIRPFLRDDRVLATGGTVRIVNGCRVEDGRVVAPRAPRRPLAGFQAVEYVRAFLVGRLGFNLLGGNIIISGAFGLFRRDAVLAAGGYDADTVGEDMELVLRLRRTGYAQGGPHKVVFIPDPVAWTEVPETMRTLGRQRDRWHRGLADSVAKHAPMLFRPRYGAVGLFVLPYYLLVELLAPVFEIVGLVALGVLFATGDLDVVPMGLFLLVTYGYGVVLTMLALLLDRMAYPRNAGPGDWFFLPLWTLLESVGYRQLTVWWRLRGLVKFLLGDREWGKMERRGFDRAAKPAATPDDASGP